MPNPRKILLFLGDAVLLYFSLLLTLFLRFLNDFNGSIFLLHLLPFSLLYLFWLIIFYIFGLYDLHLIKSKSALYSRFLVAILTGLVFGTMFFYAAPNLGITPKTNLVLNVLIFTVLFVTWRNLFYLLFSNYFLNRVTIVGQGEDVEKLKKEILEKPYLGFRLIRTDLEEDLLFQIEKEKIETVIFTEEFESNPTVLKALYFCLPAKINFLDFAEAYEIISEKIPVSMISQAWFLENLKEGEKGSYDKTKRFFDLAAAFFLLVITLPFWPFIAILIKLEDGGPVFYKQIRVGKDRKNFQLIKFRSMVVGAEKEGPKWAEKKDERITVVGKLLRNTHLDEIPQMINVLRGEISLVGPRPERPEFVEKLEKEIPHYNVRHLIKPGFTGWGQIKFRYGRSVVDSKEKFEYDLYYIKNRSLFLDLRILLKTFQLFFKRD